MQKRESLTLVFLKLVIALSSFCLSIACFNNSRDFCEIIKKSCDYNLSNIIGQNRLCIFRISLSVNSSLLFLFLLMMITERIIAKHSALLH